MEIDLLRLKNDLQKEVKIHEVLSFPEDTIKRAGMLQLEKVEVDGKISRGSLDRFILSLQMKGIMVLPCSLTLEPTHYPFEIEIEDDLLVLLEEIDENVKKIGNTIDILPIIWENILMEIPMKVVNEKASSMKMEGNGWKVITEDEKKEVVNPEFAKLKDLF